MKAQKQKVFEHLYKHGAINPRQAYSMYNVMRLAAIIHVLKKSGHDIKTKIIKTANSRFAEYSYYSDSNEQRPIEESVSPPFNTLSFKYPESQKIAFFFNGENCGRLFLKEEKLCFGGNLDTSAKALFTEVARLYNRQ